MRLLTQIQLNCILEKHKKWLKDEEGGERANLYNANLSEANLSYANLSYAGLSYANLYNANLYNANLYNADLSNANLSNADLSRAVLCNANLSKANLSNANLYNANLSNADMPNFQIVPEEGAFIGFKKLKEGIIAKLFIPTNAKRVNSTGRKCRAEYVKVLELSNGAKKGTSCHSGNLTYKLGKIVKPDSFNDDIRLECTNGIHFFITRKEAEEYSG